MGRNMCHADRFLSKMASTPRAPFRYALLYLWPWLPFLAVALKAGAPSRLQSRYAALCRTSRASAEARHEYPLGESFST